MLWQDEFWRAVMNFAADIEKINEQQRELVLPEFSEEIAWQLGLRMREMAAARGLRMAIDIRRFGQPLFYTAMAGTTPSNPAWIHRKSNVVARFYCASYLIGQILRQKGETLTERYGLSAEDYAAHGGSFPIAVRSAGVIGSLTVSGMPDRDDHQFAVESLCLHLGKNFSALKLAAEV